MPRLIGPITAAQHAASQNRAAAQATRERRLIEATINAGEQPLPYSANHGRFLRVGGRKVKLQHPDGTLTNQGRTYYDVAGTDPPLLYDYDQILVEDKFVNTYKGGKLLVRRWRRQLNEGRGGWEVTKKGEEYFRYNRDEYVVDVPCRRVVEHQGRLRLTQELLYTPIAAMKHVRRGEGGGIIPPGPDDPIVLPRITVQHRLATEQEKRAYLKEGVLQKIRENTTVIVEGREYHVVMYESDTWLVYDEDREDDWRITAQHVSFREDGRPTVETILNRPLHGATMIPLGTPYPWDLHEKCMEDTGTCLVDMIHACAIKRTSGRGGEKLTAVFPSWDECEKACDAVRAELYPDPNEYPFDGEYRGYPAQVAAEMAKRRGWVISIVHDKNKIYQWKPEGKAACNLPHLVFVIHDYHAFWYNKGQGNRGSGAIDCISRTNVRDGDPPLRKIAICGEEEREKIPTFDQWKMFRPFDFYERCLKAEDPKASRVRRRSPTEYYYSYDLKEDTKLLTQTREDVRKRAKEELEEIAKTEGKPLAEVTEKYGWFCYEDVEDHTPVRLEVRDSRCTQTPEDVKHLYVLYKTSVHVRVTQVPENAEELHDVCKTRPETN